MLLEKAALHIRTKDQRQVGKSEYDSGPAIPRPVPGERSAEKQLITSTKEEGRTMAGGGTEIRDSEEWSSHPSPSQGGPGPGCDAHRHESR